MHPIDFPESNKVLTAPTGKEGEVNDLPVCETFDSNGDAMVVSVWEPTDEEIEALILHRKLYFMCWGHTHPPITLSLQNLFGAG